MKPIIYILFTFLVFLNIHDVFAIGCDIEFHILNGDSETVEITAIATGPVYDDEFNVTSLYESGTAIAPPGESTGFSWFTDQQGPYDALAYSNYHIINSSANFYLNFYDGDYGRNIRTEHIDTDFRKYTNIDILFNYDCQTGKFTFVDNRGPYQESFEIEDGQTIGIWRMRYDYPVYYNWEGDSFACEIYQDCFQSPSYEPSIYLRNLYDLKDLSRILVDDTEYVNSWDYIEFPLGSNHTAKPENQKYFDLGGISENDVQHHHWYNYDDFPTLLNYSINQDITVNYMGICRVARFKKIIPCSLKTANLVGPECPIQIEFKDPWLIEPDGSQPGDFHGYDSPHYPGNGNGSFWNENAEFNPNKPIYSIRVPGSYDNGDEIAIFQGWTIVPEGHAELNSTGPQTDVVFKEPGVTVTANYYYWKRSAFQGSIPVDLTLDGTINVVGNVTVESGAQLTIEPGTDFLMSPYKSINVYGELYADGTSSEKITFFPDDPNSTSRTYWSGIKSYGESVILRYVEIKGGTWGVYANNSYTRLLQTRLENNHLGLYILYDNNCTVDQCTIINNNYGGYFFNSDILYANNTCSGNIKGVILSRCTGNIWSNSITDNSHTGISINNISDVSLARWSDNPEYTNNIITENTNYGIYIDGSSHPELGGFDENWKGDIYGGYNDFDHGTGNYDIYSDNSATIDARMNWWSASPSRHGNFLIFPEAGGIMPKPTGTILPKITSLSPLEQKLFQADSLVVDSMYSDAIYVYKSIFNLAPDSIESVLALGGLVNCYKKLKADSTLIAELNSIHNNYSNDRIGKAAFDYSVTEYTRQSDFQTALPRSDDVINYYVTNRLNEEAAYALLEQAMIYEIMANDPSGNGMGKIPAATLAEKSRINKDRILTNYSQSNAADFVRMLLNIESEYDNPNKPENYLPEKFALLPNYPNPFNPSTTISFTIPKLSEIEIAIYDVLGRKVKTLISEQIDIGLHKKVWNGTNQFGQQVSSGVYFYTFKAKALDDSKETFVKSAKLLLLR